MLVSCHRRHGARNFTLGAGVASSCWVGLALVVPPAAPSTLPRPGPHHARHPADRRQGSSDWAYSWTRWWTDRGRRPRRPASPVGHDTTLRVGRPATTRERMKRVDNDPRTSSRGTQGIEAAHGDLVKVTPTTSPAESRPCRVRWRCCPRWVRPRADARRVRRQGLLDAACPGEVFTPHARPMEAACGPSTAARASTRQEPGDVMNSRWRLSYAPEGTDVEAVGSTTTSPSGLRDTAAPRRRRHRAHGEDRRGSRGTAAAQGVADICREVNANARSMGRR
jgi:hypothetical protein